MIRLVLKLLIAALIANATWRVGTAYASFYKFKDSVHEAVQYGGGKSEEQLKQRILELASQFDLPVAERSFTIRRDADRTYVDGSFTRPIEVVPGYIYQWPFSWSIEVFSIDVSKPGERDLTRPK